MNSLPTAVSKQDCIRSLAELGFLTVWELNGHTLLARQDQVVSVPSTPLLDPGTLANILRTARVSNVEFTDVLASLDLHRLVDDD